MPVLPEGAEETAVRALAQATELAAGRFRSSLELSTKDRTGDLVTDVDLACEKLIVATLRERFPEHSIRTEESPGRQRGGPWEWLVDPLDGTNNFAYGLDVWGVSIALAFEGTPVFACFSEGASGSIVIARAGAGITVNGTPWSPPRRAHRPSAAFWIGYDADRRSPYSQALLDLLGGRVRRTFENWAPTADVGLYLRGGVDVVIGQDCSGMELPTVLFALREAGAVVLDPLRGEPVSLARVPALFVAGTPELVDELLPDLRELVPQTIR